MTLAGIASIMVLISLPHYLETYGIVFYGCEFLQCKDTAMVSRHSLRIQSCCLSQEAGSGPRAMCDLQKKTLSH